MLLYALCACLVFSSRVLAAYNGGPFQDLLVYYAYRMEIEVYGAGGTYLANKGWGTVRPDSTMYLDEFLYHVQEMVDSEGNPVIKWQKDNRQGFDKLLEPEVNRRTIQQLKDVGYPHRYDAHNLFPDFDQPGKTQGWNAVLGRVTGIIQATRKEAVRRGMPLETVNKYLDNIRAANRGVHAARMQQASAYFIDLCNEELKKAGANFNVETEVKSHIGLDDWVEPSYAKTVKEHPKASEEVKKALKNAINNYASRQDTQGTHWRACQASQRAAVKLWGDENC